MRGGSNHCSIFGPTGMKGGDREGRVQGKGGGGREGKNIAEGDRTEAAPIPYFIMVSTFHNVMVPLSQPPTNTPEGCSFPVPRALHTSL